MRLPRPPQPDCSGTPAISWESTGVPQQCGFPTVEARWLRHSSQLPEGAAERRSNVASQPPKPDCSGWRWAVPAPEGLVEA